MPRADRYDLTSDPLEQVNRVRTRPDKYAELLALLLGHVQRVEAGNPAIVRLLKSRAAGRPSMGCARRRLR